MNKNGKKKQNGVYFLFFLFIFAMSLMICAYPQT